MHSQAPSEVSNTAEMSDRERLLSQDVYAETESEANGVLLELARVFAAEARPDIGQRRVAQPLPSVEARYRTLVEQLPAVIFMAYLDRGIGEAYVSPQIEALLGFTQEEWLNDPVRWYRQVHSDDKSRWSVEAARMFLTGQPLRSAYRVLSRDGRVIWFHCEAKMVRGEDGRPWFIHGVGFDISELKETEETLNRREEEFRELSAKLLSIQDEERRRIARELHDGTAQNLAALTMNLSLLMNPASLADANSRRILSDSLALAEQCSREVRNLSYLLHPPLLDDLGLASALKAYLAGFSNRTDINVDLELPPDLGRLEPDSELALFRIVQEGLANAHRHSGSLQVAIRLALTQTEIKLEVADSGSGKFPGVSEEQGTGKVRLGVGIPGMRERVQQLGGQMAINSSRSGTTLKVTLPRRSSK